MKFISSIFVIASLALSTVKASAFIPTQGMTLNDVLGDKNFDIKKEKADIIIVDYETKREVIDLYHSYGKKVICYFSGGTIESWRDDVKDYEAVDGLVRNTYSNWAKEKWLDFRKSGIKPLIKKRMQIAVNNNCDALEVDNLDAYQSKDVKGVWSDPISEKDTVTFAKWLAKTAHELGITIGLKNIVGLIGDLIDDFDFALNESCDKYKNECKLYKDFVATGKAVFGITYGDFDKLLPNLCKELNGTGISLIVKESQNLKQDGKVFDGKKYCGSSFHTGYTDKVPTSSVASSRAVSDEKKESSSKKVEKAVVAENKSSNEKKYDSEVKSIKTTVKNISRISQSKIRKVIVVVKTIVKKRKN